MVVMMMVLLLVLVPILTIDYDDLNCIVLSKNIYVQIFLLPRYTNIYIYIYIYI